MGNKIKDFEKIEKVIDEVNMKWRDYYSDDCCCQINQDWGDDLGKNCWFINIDDYDNIIDEIKQKIKEIK